MRTAVTARVQNNGQSCIAAKRFIVVDAVADEFRYRFIESMDALGRGRSLRPRHQHRADRERSAGDELVGQVEEALDRAPRCTTAKIPQGDGLVVRADGPLGCHD